jgi:magnesium transporter
MIKIFYRLGNEIMLSRSQTEFATISKENVLWIDILEPTGEEKRATEEFLGTEIQSRDQTEEIESSSRFSEDEIGIYANTYFLSPTGDEMSSDPVSFIITDHTLTTLRDIPLRSFDLLQMKVQARPEMFPDAFTLFLEIMEKRVDLDADIVELFAKDTSQYSKRINQQEDISEEFLLDINQLQENAMVIRANVVDKQRLLSNLVKSRRCPKDPELREELNVLIQDISSLINHINFTFERLEYLQDTVLGIINLDQNKIMKIFTVITLLIMPATFVASFYGMNVALPFDKYRFAWLGILLLMVILALAFWYIFRKKKML